MTHEHNQVKMIEETEKHCMKLAKYNQELSE